MAGSYVLTDTIFAAFDDIFSESLKGTSVVVTAKNPVEQENGEVPTISASLLPRIQRTPGVRLASGAIFTPGGFFDARTATRSAPNSPPSSSPRTSPTASSRSPTSRGTRRAAPRKPRSTSRRPKTPTSSSATRSRSSARAAPAPSRLIGLTHLGSASFGGASIAQVTLPVAQTITHKGGRFDQISVAADKRRLADRAQTPDRPADARLGAGRDGAGKRRPQLRRNPRQPRLPPDLPARLRLHRPLRRRLPDLQHLLDHRRPAGHASSGCCARSAPRGARSSRR